MNYPLSYFGQRSNGTNDALILADIEDQSVMPKTIGEDSMALPAVSTLLYFFAVG